MWHPKKSTSQSGGCQPLKMSWSPSPAIWTQSSILSAMNGLAIAPLGWLGERGFEQKGSMKPAYLVGWWSICMFFISKRGYMMRHIWMCGTPNGGLKRLHAVHSHPVELLSFYLTAAMSHSILGVSEIWVWKVKMVSTLFATCHTISQT